VSTHDNGGRLVFVGVIADRTVRDTDQRRRLYRRYAGIFCPLDRRLDSLIASRLQLFSNVPDVETTRDSSDIYDGNDVHRRISRKREVNTVVYGSFGGITSIGRYEQRVDIWVKIRPLVKRHYGHRRLAQHLFGDAPENHPANAGPAVRAHHYVGVRRTATRAFLRHPLPSDREILPESDEPLRKLYYHARSCQ